MARVLVECENLFVVVGKVEAGKGEHNRRKRQREGEIFEAFRRTQLGAVLEFSEHDVEKIHFAQSQLIKLKIWVGYKFWLILQYSSIRKRSNDTYEGN